MTLTSRTDIWEVVTAFQNNPLGGAGFDTFWAGERLRLLEDKTFGIIQAHNGFIETYLNGGWIGVGLLIILLISGYWRIRKKLPFGRLEDITRFALFVIVIIYNFSEASFNKNGPIWLVTLFAIMEYRAQRFPRESIIRSGQQ
jgi:O-antigen ligase